MKLQKTPLPSSFPAFSPPLPLSQYQPFPFCNHLKPSISRPRYRLSLRTRPLQIACLPSPYPRTLIIGGGAAGFFCAVSLSRLCPTPITILEASPKVLEKVRISGGARCNVTSGLFHTDPLTFSEQYARGTKEMPAVLNRFGAGDVVRFFEDEGVALKTEESGKVFPVSDSSESVVGALVDAARNGGVTLRTKAKVVDVRNVNDKFEVVLKGGEVLQAEHVVVATGSARKAYEWADRMGHCIVPPVPSLFSFRVGDRELRQLAGVSVGDVKVELLVEGKVRKRVSGLVQRGSLLVTHWGLSGPVVLSLSAFGARVLSDRKYKMGCMVDWVPQLSLQEKVRIVKEMKGVSGMKNVGTVGPFRRMIPNRMWRYLVAKEGGLEEGKKWGAVRLEEIERLARMVHGCKFEICGKGEFKEEFVTAGGVALKSVNTKTFESKHMEGLFFAGETLDVDGRTGGYNLQHAWSTGFIVAKTIAHKVSNPIDSG